MQLNSQQLKAIKHKSGPLLIVAGAGTGKTTVITERVKYLIKKQHIDPQAIFAVTFTQKAADELVARLDQVMPLGYRTPWLGTFHSLCERLLKLEGLEIGLAPNFQILTVTDQWLLLKHHLFDLPLNYYRPLGNPNRFLSALIKVFSRLQDEDISPAEFARLAHRKAKAAQSDDEAAEAQRLQELSQTFQAYQQLKLDQALYDFGDLITLTLKLLKERPNLLKKYRHQFSHLLVDEFQDTNIAQYELIKLLAPKDANPNLTVVGDDNQCLPATAQIHLQSGAKAVKDIKQGDEVLSAAGKGYTTYAKVTKVMKNTGHFKFIALTTKSGTKIITTDNHKMFCYVDNLPDNKLFHYVYLMFQKEKGWRIGKTNNLSIRIRLENQIDFIIAIKACQSDQEARYYETLYSLKYGIPTTAFAKRKGMVITDEWLVKLLQEIDTQKAVESLAHDINIDISQPHIYSAAVNQNHSHRLIVNVYLNYLNYSSKHTKNGLFKSPFISHLVHFETSNLEIIQKLKQAGYNLKPAKKGIRIRYANKDLQTAIHFAEQLAQLTGAFIVHKSNLAKRNIQTLTSRIIPAKNIFPGMYIPVLKENFLINEQIVARHEFKKYTTVYDLEVTPTHNFIADNVAVHNSIYKFRGASVSNILNFKSDYPTAAQIVLNQNYRSTQPILNAAYTLIKNNDPDTLEAKLGISKKLQSQIKTGSTLETTIISAPTLNDEVDWTVKKIIDLVINHQLTHQDIAILTRANSHLEPYIQALKAAGLPYQVVSNRGLFDQPEIRSLIYFIRVLLDPHDSIALFQLILDPPFLLNPSLVFTANQKASRHSTSLWDQLVQSNNQSVQDCLKVLQTFQDQTSTQPTSVILYRYIEETQYLKPFLETESVQNSLKVKNLNLFFQKIKSFELQHDEISITNFMAAYESWLEAGENPGQAQIEDIDTISLMTVHAAKGLEFKAVFVGSCIAGRFPSRNRKDPILLPDELVKESLPEGDEHIEEERRLMYVAMTRAQHFLYLTYATDMGGVRKRHESGFLQETKLPTLTLPPQADALIVSSPPSPTVQYASEGKYTIKRLSYSQIDTFKTCPLKYKYRYLLQIPSPPHHSVSFGRTIHATLQAFHQQEMQGHQPTLKDLIDLYQQNFITEGYESKQHQEERFKAGQAALQQYYQSYQQLFARPVMLEQSFTLNLDGIKFVGKIDRVDQRQDGTHAIIDYKTGQPKDQKKVDRDEQLTIYALAAKQALGLKVSDLSLYFLESNQKVSSTRSDKQLDQETAKLKQTINQIKHSDFPAKPDPVTCGFCEYHDLCPFSATKT